MFIFNQQNVGKSEQSIYYLLKRCHLLAGIYSTALHNDEQHGSDVDL